VDALELASELGAGHVAGVTIPLTTLAGTPRGARAVRVVGTTASLFGTLAIGIASGRGFGVQDTASRLVLLSPAAARTLWAVAERTRARFTIEPDRCAAVRVGRLRTTHDARHGRAFIASRWLAMVR